MVIPAESLYADAAVYDTLFAWATPSDLADLRRAFSLAEGSVRNVLDLGCGTGRLSIPVALAGYSVIGVDSSPTMLARAEEQAAEQKAHVGFVAGDLGGLPHLPTADAAFCLMQTVSYLTTPELVLNHLRSVGACVRPGGIYAVGFSQWRHGGPPEDDDPWTEINAGSSTTFLWTVDSVDETSGTVSCTSSVSKNGAVPSVEKHTMKLWSPGEWVRLVQESGAWDVAACWNEAGEEEAHDSMTEDHLTWVLRRR